MIIRDIKNLAYCTPNNTHISLIGTCEEYGIIPMALNITDTEDLHMFGTGTFKTVIKDGKTIKEEVLIPLEAYCKTLPIAAYVAPAEVVVIPSSISRRQARRFLLDIDKLDEVEESIATNRMYQIEYEADTFERSNLMIPIIQELLELTDSEVDSMFLAASKL